MPQFTNNKFNRPFANSGGDNNTTRALPLSTFAEGIDGMISRGLTTQNSDYSNQGSTAASANNNNELLRAPHHFNGTSSFPLNPMMHAAGSVANDGQSHARWQDMNKNTVSGATTALTSFQNGQNGANHSIQNNPYIASTNNLPANASTVPNAAFIGGVDGAGKFALPFPTFPFGQQQQEQGVISQSQSQIPSTGINKGASAAADGQAATAPAASTKNVKNENSNNTAQTQLPIPISFEAFMNAAAMSAAAAASGMNLPPAAFATMTQNGGMNIANMAQFMTSMNMNPFMAAAAASAVMPGALPADATTSQQQRGSSSNGATATTPNPTWVSTGPPPQPHAASRNEPVTAKANSFAPPFQSARQPQMPNPKAPLSGPPEMPRPPLDRISQLTAAAAAAAPPFASAASSVPTAPTMSQQDSNKVSGGTSIQQLGLYPAKLPTPTSASFNLQTVPPSVPKINPSASATGTNPAFVWPMPAANQQQQQEISELPASFSANTGTPTPPWSNVSTPISNIFGTQAVDSQAKLENGVLGQNAVNEPSPKRVRIDPALLQQTSKGSTVKNGAKKAEKDDDESEEDNLEDGNQDHGGDEKDQALRKRLERNMREQHRSQKITNQIKDLRQILSHSKIIYKPTKFSILKSAAEYIQTLQENLKKGDAINESMRKAIAYATQVASTGIDPAEQQVQQYAAPQAQDAAPPNMSATVSVQGPSPSNSGQDKKSESRSKLDKDSMKCHTGNITEAKDFKTIFELCPNPFAIFALDGTFVECNRAFGRITRYSKSEIQQHSLFHYLKNDDMANIFKAMGRMLKNSGLGLSNQASSGETAIVSLESVSDESLFWTGLVYPHQDSEKEFELLMNITIAKSAAGAPLFLNVSMSALDDFIEKTGQKKNP